MDRAELERRFNYHAPDSTRALQHEQVRHECLHLARVFNATLPDGREKDLVITHLEEVMFWANAAIARVSYPVTPVDDS